MMGSETPPRHRNAGASPAGAAPLDGPGTCTPGRGRAAAAGVVAAAVALGVGELLAGLLSGVPSPVVAVGAGVIDAAPPAVKDAAIAILGTADKPALVVGIVVLSLAAGGLLGAAAARRFVVAVVGFCGFGLLGMLATARDPRAATGSAALSAALAVAAGLGTLRWLLTVASRPVAAGDGSREAEQMGPRADRRGFLWAAATATTAAALSASAGRLLSARARTTAARAAVVLPRPTKPLPTPAPGSDLAVAGLSPFHTPNERFFRIDTALSVPRIDPATWRLRLVGMVDRPFVLSYAELLALPQVEADITLACVSNEVGGDLVGNARWLGVRLADLLTRAGVRPEATQVVGRSVDGFTVGFPTRVALDGRDALVAVGMNGEPLPVAHGFPARLVVPGLYGYVSATKWLAEIELTTWESFDAYWVPRGWSKEGPVKTQSRIDVPVDGATVAAGRRVVAGVAWAQRRGIDRVEVQVDDEPWQPARLRVEAGVDTWRQWAIEWDARPGAHTLRCRATDRTGRRQTERRTPPAPDGATGWHTIRVQVR